MSATGATPFGRGVRIARIGGTPILLHWSASGVAVALTGMLALGVLPAAVPHRGTAAYWLTAVLAATALLACVVGHELAHAAAAIGLRRPSAVPGPGRCSAW